MYKILLVLGYMSRLTLAAHCVSTIEVLKLRPAVRAFRGLLVLPLWVIKRLPREWTSRLWNEFDRLAETNLIHNASAGEKKKLAWFWREDFYVKKWGWGPISPDWFTDAHETPVVQADSFMSWYAQL